MVKLTYLHTRGPVKLTYFDTRGPYAILLAFENPSIVMVDPTF